MKYKIKIYQLNTENKNLLFERYSTIERMNININVDTMYNLVYTFDAYDSIPHIDMLNQIYNYLQFSHPYKGHSVSISDIIAIDDKKYYVDAFGFKLLK